MKESCFFLLVNDDEGENNTLGLRSEEERLLELFSDEERERFIVAIRV